MADEVSSETAVCSACGQVNPVGNKFCGGCGKAMGAEQIAPVSPVTVAAPPRGLEGIARERERDRLLTLANVQRMRGQLSDAQRTLQEALVLMEGMPDPQVAPIHELLGDLYLAEVKWQEAAQAFNKAHVLDPSRVSAERKFAAMTLRLADLKAETSIADAMLRGDSISDLMASAASGASRGKRNAGLAMFLSMFVPGFGQFYNGDLIKGGALLGVWMLCVLLFNVSPERNAFFGKFAALVAMNAAKANAPISPFLVIIGVIFVGVWLYSIVDAPFMASRAPKDQSAAPVIDKTGWEV